MGKNDERIKTIILSILILILYLITLVTAIIKKSDYPVILHFSKNYFVGVVLPLLFLCPIFFYLIKFEINLIKLILKNRFTKLVTLVLLILINVGLFIYSGNIGSNYTLTLILPFFIFFITMFSLYLIYDIKLLPGLLFFLFMFFICILLGEIIFKLIKSEKEYAQYEAAFKYRILVEEPFVGEGGRFQPNLNLTMYSPYKKDGVQFITNSHGFRTKEDVDYNPETIRILLLGDSFANGYRIDQETFFGTSLEKNLSIDANRKIQVLSAEVAYPGLGLYYLSKYGLKYHPQIVVYGLCGNDILQSFIFVGKDKLFYFNKSDELLVNKSLDNKKEDFYTFITNFKDLKYENRPSLSEKIIGYFANSIDNYYELLKKVNLFQPFFYLKYKYIHPDGETMYSYLSKYEVADSNLRLFNGNANFGFYLKSEPEIASQMLARFQKIILRLNKICNDQNICFILINFPQRYQVNSRDWQAEKKKWRLKEEDFDLSKLNRQIADFCKSNQICYIDFLDIFKKEAQFQQLYLPGGDMHINEVGHKLAAKIAAEQIEKSGFIKESGKPNFYLPH